MTNEELKTKITELLPAATFEEGGEWLNINIAAERLVTVCTATYAMTILYSSIIFFALPALTGRHILPWCIIYHLPNTVITLLSNQNWTEIILK